MSDRFSDPDYESRAKEGLSSNTQSNLNPSAYKDKHYQFLLNQIPQMVSYVSRDFIYQFVNKSYEKRFNIKSEEILGKNIVDIIGEETYNKAWPHLERVLKGEEVKYIEKFTYPGQQPSFIEGHLIPDFNEKNEVIGWYGVLNDVTEHIQNLDKIKTKQRQLDLLANNIQDVIWSADLQFNLAYINSHVYEVFGYTADEIMAIPMSDLYPSRTVSNMHEILHKEYQKAIQGMDTETPVFVETEIYHKSGEKRYVELKADFVYNSNKLPVGISGVTRDITEKRAAELALKENQMLLSAVWEITVDGMVISDSKGEMLKVNPQFCQIYGFAEDELIGENFAIIFPANQRDIANQEYQKIFQQPEIPPAFETEIYNHSGVRKIIESRVQFLYHNGKRTAMLSVVRDVTEQKAAQKRIVESEEKFRLITENSNDLISMLENDKIVYVSPSIKDIFGYEPEEYLKLDYLSLIHPDDLDSFLQTMQSRLSQKSIKKHAYVLRHQHKAGHYVWVESITKNKILKEDHVLTVFNTRDITHRVQIENALKESRARFKNIIDTTDAGYFLVDQVGLIKEVNQAWLRLHGYERSEVIGKRFLEFIQPSEIDQAEELFAKLSKGESISSGEMSRIQKDGKTGYHTYTVHSVHENDQLIGYEGFIIDTTEIHRTTQALRESERKLSIIADNIDAAIWLQDETKFLYLSNAFEEIWEVPIKMMLDNPSSFRDFIHEEDQTYVEEKHIKTLIQKEDFEGKYRIITPTGKVKWIWAKTFLVDEQSGLRVGIAKDVTDIKNYEQQLIQANEELDNFVYRVSHDLRAPITSSLGLSKLLQLEKDRDKIVEYAKLQETSLIKLDKFIKDVLDYSRNARMVIEPTTLHFNDIIEGIYQNLKQDPAFRKVNLTYEINDQKPYYSDPLRLNIILNNLISNAFKFRNPFIERPYVHVNVEINTKAIIKISDNGQGIPEKHLNKVFDMFYRATQKNPGSGIGLYIVQESIKKLNGNICVESDYGKGTTFTVELPNMLPDQAKS